MAPPASTRKSQATNDYWGDHAHFEDLDHLRREEKFSDFIISCRGRELRVHRILLAAQSTFFEGLFSNDFKESRERKVDLDDDDPEEIELMMHFLYRDKYQYDKQDDPQDNPEELRGTRAMDMRMYVLGDKYGIESLKEYANDRLNDDYVFDLAPDMQHHMLAMIRYAYAHSRPDDQRLVKALVTDMCLEGEMGEHRALNALSRDRWVQLATEVPEFVADVVKVIAKKRMIGDLDDEGL